MKEKDAGRKEQEEPSTKSETQLDWMGGLEESMKGFTGEHWKFKEKQ